MTGAAPVRRTVVLESFPRPRPTTNPYLVQLARSMPPEVDVVTFSWRTALVGRYDVFHVHWPENLVRGASRVRTLARTAAAAALAVRLAVGRTPVVRTLHNVTPHEAVPPTGRVVLRLLDRLTTVWIRLQPWTPVPPGAVAVTIPHGHYREWYPRARSARVPGRLLFAGLVRPYKGVDALLDAFAGTGSSDVSLRVVGRPTDEGLAEDVRRAGAADPRVTARLEYVDDATLAEEVAQAELVVLPYRRMHNSGAALLALSLDRPVLVPAGRAAAELADEVGAGWVSTFKAPLRPEDLERALARARTVSGRPDLSTREWPGAGRAHADAFAQALALRRAVRRRRRPAALPVRVDARDEGAARDRS